MAKKKFEELTKIEKFYLDNHGLSGKIEELAVDLGRDENDEAFLLYIEEIKSRPVVNDGLSRDKKNGCVVMTKGGSEIGDTKRSKSVKPKPFIHQIKKK